MRDPKSAPLPLGHLGRPRRPVRHRPRPVGCAPPDVEHLQPSPTQQAGQTARRITARRQTRHLHLTRGAPHKVHHSMRRHAPDARLARENLQQPPLRARSHVVGYGQPGSSRCNDGPHHRIQTHSIYTVTFGTVECARSCCLQRSSAAQMV